MVYKGNMGRRLAGVAVILLAAGGLLWHFRIGAPIAAGDVPRDVVEGEDVANAQVKTDAAAGRLTVHVDKPGAKISPMLYGLTLEEINHALDGGLYGELLQNRDLTALTGRMQGTKAIIWPESWTLDKGPGAEASMDVERRVTVAGAGAHAAMRLTITALPQGGRVGVINPGYWGIPVKAGWTYRASFYAKASADFAGPVTVGIESNDGRVTVAQAMVEKVGMEWKRYEVTLKAGEAATSAENRFVMLAGSTGTLWVTEASLFPPTYQDRPNGNRIDLMEKLAALRPGFVEFPGGDYMIGISPQVRFDWKKAVGPEEMRSGQPSRWERSSNGFGLMEFLRTCEELKAEPVLALYAGTSLAQSVEAGTALQPYVQDALEEIEYVVGDAATPGGMKRAADGHAAPFKLEYVQIGNNEELFGKGTYDARFTQFYDAIKGKYPGLKIIGWMNLATTRTPDVIHESQYRTARELMAQSTHFDSYSRGGAGGGTKYATEFNASEGDPTQTLKAGLANMAWLMGAERNSDVVAMAVGAPLFINVNVGAQQHDSDLIGYDAVRSYGSPAYYAQRMFSENKGDVVLPVELKAQEAAAVQEGPPHGAIGVGAWGSDVEYKDVQVTGADGKVLYTSDFSKGMEGWRMGAGTWKVEDGALRQTSGIIGCTALAGDPAWTDYTLTLKAKKNSGVEGFLVIVHAADSGNMLWCNLGGWMNSRMGMEQTQDGAKGPVGDGAAGRIEPGKWYDIKVEVNGDDVVCYVDGAAVLSGRERARPARVGAEEAVFATASRDAGSGEVIVKVVNALPTAQWLEVNLAGVNGVKEAGTVEVLSGKPGDVNTVDAPEKVVPRRMTDRVPGARFVHEFPAYSASVLRVKAR